MYNIPYEEWVSRIYYGAKKRLYFWDFYKTIEMVLPDKYKIPLLMNCIYVSNDNMEDDFFNYLQELIINESDIAKSTRKEMNLQTIHSVEEKENVKLMDVNGLIRVYRGIHGGATNEMGVFEANKGIEDALSYTFNRTVAEWFSIRFKSEDCSVISAKVHIDDILSIYLARQESEIMIIPPSLGGKLIDIKTEKIVPDIKIMQQFDKLRVS